MAHDEISGSRRFPSDARTVWSKPQTVGGLIARDAVICSSCGHSINVKDGEWRAFVLQIANACAESRSRNEAIGAARECGTFKVKIIARRERCPHTIFEPM